MQIYSGLVNARIELDGYINNESNLIITHKSLVDYLARMKDTINISYTVIKAELDHAVVMCELTSRMLDKKVTELGETTRETLGNHFANYPVITAQEMAYDRAAIRFLQLPDNCYSVLEFIRNSFGINNLLLEQNEYLENGQERGSLSEEKPELKNFIVDFGIFKGNGCTVEQVFEQARKDKKVKATLDIYLSKNVADIGNKTERYSILALQRYATKIGYM